MFLYFINNVSGERYRGDKAVLGDDPMVAKEGYSDCCGMLGITCQKDNSSCVASVN